MEKYETPWMEIINFDTGTIVNSLHCASCSEEIEMPGIVIP